MDNVWVNSIELMLLGMGTVFIFLSLLVVGVILMSGVINKFAATESISKNSHAATPDAEIAAVAVSAWVKAHTN